MHDFCSRGNGSTLMECCNCWHDFTCAPIPSCWPGLGCVLWIAKVSSHTCVLPYLHCNSLWCTHRTVLCCVGTASFKLLMSYLLICLLIPAFQPFWCAPGSWVWGNWITITVALYLCTGTGRGTRSVSRGHISFSTCRKPGFLYNFHWWIIKGFFCVSHLWTTFAQNWKSCEEKEISVLLMAGLISTVGTIIKCFWLLSKYSLWWVYSHILLVLLIFFKQERNLFLRVHWPFYDPFLRTIFIK